MGNKGGRRGHTAREVEIFTRPRPAAEPASGASGTQESLRIPFRDTEQLEVGAPGPPSALLPASNPVWADVQVAREEHLARVERTADSAYVSGPHFRRRGGEFADSKVDRLTAFEGEGAPERFAEFVKHLSLYCLFHWSSFYDER